MCGRFQLLVTWKQLVELMVVHGIRERGTGEYIPHKIPDPPLVPFDLPLFNVCPTDHIAVVVHQDGRRLPTNMRWGFPASWLAKSGKNPWSRALVNAQAEEAHRKPTWRASLKERRCLVPSTGFIEWLREGKKRWPLHFKSPTEAHGLLAFAAIWQAFEKEGQQIQCVTLLTIGPSPDIAAVHDRMPVVLAPEDWDTWLDPATPKQVYRDLLKPAPAGTLVWGELHTEINKAGRKSADVLRPNWRLDEVAPSVLAGLPPRADGTAPEPA